MHRTRMTAAIGLLAAMASACSGPRAPVPVGIREVPADVTLAVVAAEPEVPVLPPPVPLPVPRRLPTPEPPPSPAPPSPTAPSEPPPTPTVACPEADPFTFARDPAEASAWPPTPATYEYRVDGKINASGAEEALPTTMTRTVRNVEEASDGGFTFETVERHGDREVVQHHDVVPESVLTAPQAGELVPGGIYVTRTVVTEGGETATYTWNPPVQLITLPAEPGDTWQVDSQAVETGAVLRYAASIGQRVTYLQEVQFDPPPPPLPPVPLPPALFPDTVLEDEPRVRVDACGEWVNGWRVLLAPNDEYTGEESTGQYVSPLDVLTFRGDYVVATQSGGLLVAETLQLSGVRSGAPFSLERNITINVVPEPANFS